MHQSGAPWRGIAPLSFRRRRIGCVLSGGAGWPGFCSVVTITPDGDTAAMDTTKQHELSRESIRLMLMMRRMVREEFGVTVPLSDDGATEELLAFAARARNTLLQQMARELEALLAEAPAVAVVASEEAAAAAAKPADVRRIYRGRAVG